MNYKIANLSKLVYLNFIKGEYGFPRVPSYNEVLKKVYEITGEDYSPILDKDRLNDLDIKDINSKFNKTIDDIAVLFSAMEDQSDSILDQLTDSLKEYNGLRLELKLINNDVKDLINIKNGNDYVQQTYTEHFESLKNILELKSDPVSTKDECFTILDNSGKNITFNHYKGKRFDLNIIEYFSPIKSSGFIGITDAEAILNSRDNRQIVYRIQTEKPTSIKAVTQIQLNPNGTKEEINRVDVDVDYSRTKGFIKVYYMDSYNWKELPHLSIQEIKNNKVSFNFRSVSTSHIKIEFQKYGPDNKVTNEYFIAINNIRVGLATPKSMSVVYSKPIIIGDNKKLAYIANLICDVDANIPSGCNVELYLAQDIKINGQFLDKYGNVVEPGHLGVFSFDSTKTGTVFLSDMWQYFGKISGLDKYESADFIWKQIAIGPQQKISAPDIINFGNISDYNSIINSIAQSDVSGWWRPQSDTAIHGQTPYSNITENDISPDYYFGGNKFYKIYRFPSDAKILESTVRLYTYEDNKYSSSNNIISFDWKDRSTTAIEKRTYINQEPIIESNTFRTGWDGAILVIDYLNDEEKYSGNPIILKKNGSNKVYDTSNYSIEMDEEHTYIRIDLSDLDNLHEPLDTTFDVIADVIVPKSYQSTATGYAIVPANSSSPNIKINNLGDTKLINNVYITDLDNDITTKYSQSESYEIKFNQSQDKKIYKIVFEYTSDNDLKMNINDRISMSDGIRIISNVSSIQIVDMHNLIYNSKYSDNEYASIIEENGYKYIITKEPPKSKIGGYYFDEESRSYQFEDTHAIPNTSHFVRRQKINDSLVTYTTGSIGTAVYVGSDPDVRDNNWNNGNTIREYKNDDQTTTYDNHSTYGSVLNIDGDVLNSDNIKGFLYYPTGENLPAYYTITYKMAGDDLDYINRFLYKLKLTSTNVNGMVPKVKSIQFIVNKENEK